MSITVSTSQNRQRAVTRAPQNSRLAAHRRLTMRISLLCSVASIFLHSFEAERPASNRGSITIPHRRGG